MNLSSIVLDNYINFDTVHFVKNKSNSKVEVTSSMVTVRNERSHHKTSYTKYEISALTSLKQMHCMGQFLVKVDQTPKSKFKDYSLLYCMKCFTVKSKYTVHDSTTLNFQDLLNGLHFLDSEGSMSWLEL